MFNYVNQVSLGRASHMCHMANSLMESSLRKVMTMYHCSIGEAFHKVAYHMTTHEWFVLWEWGLPHVKLSSTKITFIGFWCILAF